MNRFRKPKQPVEIDLWNRLPPIPGSYKIFKIRTLILLRNGWFSQRLHHKADVVLSSFPFIGKPILFRKWKNFENTTHVANPSLCSSNVYKYKKQRLLRRKRFFWRFPPVPNRLDNLTFLKVRPTFFRASTANALNVFLMKIRRLNFHIFL